jgi:hypothetical protein
MQNKFPWKTLLWVSVFGVAFAMVETAVVIYLRALYYPEGFAFPLRMISPGLIGVEIAREAATMLLLLSMAIIAGRKLKASFAWFIYAFAVWDIFYYILLWVFLGWPQSLLTWDILFLIPFTWVGPVIAPVINSLMMIALAMIIIRYGKQLVMKTRHWIGLILGALIVIASYTEDYLHFMLQDFKLGELLGGSNTEEVIAAAGNYVPDQFSWWIFLIGAGIHAVVIAEMWLKSGRKYQHVINE